jgi:hypothetical protein
MSITTDLGDKLQEDMIHAIHRYLSLCNAVDVPRHEAFATINSVLTAITVNCIRGTYRLTEEEFLEVMIEGWHMQVKIEAASG